MVSVSMIGLELGVYLEPEMCKLFRWIVIDPETYKMWTFVFSVYISSDTLLLGHTVLLKSA